MDINQLLLWIVCTSCILNIIVGIRRVGMRHSAVYIRSWILVAGFILVATATAYFLIPAKAGLIAGGLWGIFMLVPILGFRLVNQLAITERFGAASQLGNILYWLHPIESWHQYSNLLWALELIKQGATDQAEGIINRYKSTNSFLARQTMATLYQMEGRWQDLLEWIDTELPQRILQTDPNLVIYYLRALGETGQLNRLLQELERFELILEQTDTGVNQNLGRLFAFAFCGQKEQLIGLFKGALAFYPSHTRQFWLATVNWTAGDKELARQQFLALSNTSSLFYQNAIQKRLSEPLIDPQRVLTLESRQILSRLTVDLQHQVRYSGRDRFMGAKAYATWAIIGLNVLMFIAEVKLGGSQNIYTLYRLGALVPEDVFNGDWWRLLTSTFLHFGFLHLLMNMFGLYILGPFVEYALGIGRYLLLYLTTGIGSMLVVCWATELGYSQAEFVVGASGCVMGIVGATAAILLRGWYREKSRVASKRLQFILFIIAFQVVFDLSNPEISFTGHTSGLMIGFIVGSLLKADWQGQG